MKNATLIHYTDQSFTDWQTKLDAELEPGYIAVDVGASALIASFPEQDNGGIDLQAVEETLREEGYTIGINLGDGQYG